MYSFNQKGSIKDFQQFVLDVYGSTDDRLYSIWDLLTQQQRFTMRTLKGIRKGDKEKIRTNLVISMAWTMAIANRLHIDMEDALWKRFPMLCSYCGQKPCACKKTKQENRLVVKVDNKLRPSTLAEFQKMFAEIYPPHSRTLSDAGVHFAEEDGEVSEAVHNFFGQHKSSQFDQIKLEVADFISCSFGVANSAGINMAAELAENFFNNCHVCHEAPCTCKFSAVVEIKT